LNVGEAARAVFEWAAICLAKAWHQYKCKEG
jgi:hypothetical protein